MTSATIRSTEDGPHPEAGFSLLELVLVLTVLVPILTGIAATSKAVNTTIDTNARNAEVVAYSRRICQRIGKLVRPLQMSTISMPAVQEDVDALRASSVGEWIAPSDLVWRPGIDFQSASGLLSMNAALSTSPRRIEFTLDATETDNDIDDDGDGLVDEGTITLTADGVTLAILSNVETCELSLDDRIITLRIGVARVDREKNVYRAQVEQSYFMRNN